MRAIRMQRRRDKEESDAAMTIGYATMQCGTEDIANILETILNRTKDADLRAALFLVMHQQEIRVPQRFAEESRAIIAAVNERTNRQRASIAAAREERQAYAEFRRARQAKDLVKGAQIMPSTEDKL